MILNQEQAKAVVKIAEVMASTEIEGMITVRFPFDTHVCELEQCVMVKKFIGPHRYRSERYATWQHFREAYGIEQA